MHGEIIIANTAEAFESVLARVKPRTEQARRIRHEHELSDRALLWGGDNKVVILPREPLQELVHHLKQVAALRELRVLWPTRCGLNLCDAVSIDSRLRTELSRLIRGSPRTRITSYTFTSQFAALLRSLHAQGLTFESSDGEASNVNWATRYLDSKAGFRVEMAKLARDVPDLLLPEEFVCADAGEALGVVDWFLMRGRNCIVKASQGESGWGLHFVKFARGEFARKALRTAKMVLGGDAIWTSGPLIVEEWIEVTLGRDAQSPSAEMYVSDEGAQLTGVCAQLVDDLGRFGGVIIGPGFPRDRHRRQIERVAATIGRHFHGLGVRGHFDIDFVISTEGRVVAVETNVRRTGGTHVFDLKSRLGSAFAGHFFLAEDNYWYGTIRRSPAEIFQRLSSILFSHERREGVIITLLPHRSCRLGYIIVAPHYARLTSLWEQLRNALS